MLSWLSPVRGPLKVTRRSAGRPLPTADVRIRRQLVDGGIRETQLVATTPGSYRGALPNAGANTNGLTMRILLGSLRYEVPLAE